MRQLQRNVVPSLGLVLALSGCLGPAPGSPEWNSIQQAKMDKFFAECAAAGHQNCTYTYTNDWNPRVTTSNTDCHRNTVGGPVRIDCSSLDAPSQVDSYTSGVPVYSTDPASSYTPDAYGPGINSDATGRPFIWKPDFGGPALGPIKPDAYGPGIGMDATGRPVRRACPPGSPDPC